MKAKIGLLLFIAYLAQALLPWEWQAMAELQSGESYKKWTGFLLFLLILFQWTLVIARGVYEKNGKEKEKQVTLHKWVGVLSPVVFYVHSTSPGYGLLLFLTVIFFANFILGFLNDLPFELKKLRYFNLWLGAHILFSALILLLSVLHVWLVFAYS